MENSTDSIQTSRSSAAQSEGRSDGHTNQSGAGESYEIFRLAFSVSETAIILGVSEKSVRRLIDRKLLRPSRALRHLLIPRSEIERFLHNTLSQ